MSTYSALDIPSKGYHSPPLSEKGPCLHIFEIPACVPKTETSHLGGSLWLALSKSFMLRELQSHFCFCFFSHLTSICMAWLWLGKILFPSSLTFLLPLHILHFTRGSFILRSPVRTSKYMFKEYFNITTSKS